MISAEEKFFHLSGPTLGVGSIIVAGNYGSIVRKAGWSHTYAWREAVLEQERLDSCPTKPSRLQAAYAFLTREEAELFRATVHGFQTHHLYQVALESPQAPAHIADWRFCQPQGAFRLNWANAYWHDWENSRPSIEGIDWTHPDLARNQREIITLSNLIISERLD